MAGWQPAYASLFRPQAALLQRLRAKRASQLEVIFQSHQFAAHPGLASLSAAVAAARTDATQNAGWAAQYATADVGLRRALDLLQAALQSLKGARRVGTVGMVQVRRGVWMCKGIHPLCSMAGAWRWSSQAVLSLQRSLLLAALAACS